MNYPLAKTVRIDFREPIKFLAVPQMKGFRPETIKIQNAGIWPWDDEIETLERENESRSAKTSTATKFILAIIIPLVVVGALFFIIRHFRKR
jgi:hypothetical protein